jgi:hypothetical protein
MLLAWLVALMEEIEEGSSARLADHKLGTSSSREHTISGKDLAGEWTFVGEEEEEEAEEQQGGEAFVGQDDGEDDEDEPRLLKQKQKQKASQRKEGPVEEVPNNAGPRSNRVLALAEWEKAHNAKFRGLAKQEFAVQRLEHLCTRYSQAPPGTTLLLFI